MLNIRCFPAANVRRRFHLRRSPSRRVVVAASGASYLRGEPQRLRGKQQTTTIELLWTDDLRPMEGAAAVEA